MQGILCLGPDRGTKPTYILFNDRMDRANLVTLSLEAACEELVRRYMAAYDSASAGIISVWSNLPISEVLTVWKRIAGSLVEVEIADQYAWMLKAYLTQLDEFLLPFSGDTDAGRLQQVSPWLQELGHGRSDPVSEAHRRRRRDDTPGAASP